MMATTPLFTDDLLERAVGKRYDDQDAAFWQQSLKQRAKPTPVDRDSIKALVAHLAPEYGVDPGFATAIAQTESNFQPTVTSSAGAQGIMQLMPATAKRFGVRDSLDPEQNIRGGLQYLSLLQRLFPGRQELQMAAYNAGEGAIKKYGEQIPPYPETQEYVRRVTKLLGGQDPIMVAQRRAFEQAATNLGVGQPANETPSQAPYVPPARPPEEGPPLPTVTAAPVAMPPSTPLEAGATAPPGEEPWMPARKPIETGLMMGGNALTKGLSVLGAAGGATIAGATKVAASVLESPSTALRMAGVGGVEPTVLENMAGWLRQTVATPLETAAKAHLPNLVTNFYDAAGQTGFFLLPGMGIERAATTITALAPRIGAMFGIGSSAVLQGTVAMNDTYHSLEPLVGKDEASKRAQTAFMANSVLGGLGSAFGIFNKWVPEALSRVVAGATTQEMPRMIQAAGRALGTTLEAVQTAVPAGVIPLAAGAAAQGVQGAIQYDVNRHLFWVNGEAANAKALLEMGWERQGDRVVQPYHVKDQLEAAVINAVVGGVFGAAHAFSALPFPAELEHLRHEPGFTVERALQAALHPETPPAGIAPETWQRWGQPLLDMLPYPYTGQRAGVQQVLGGGGNDGRAQARRALISQRSLAEIDLNTVEAGGEKAPAILERLGVATPEEAQTTLRTQLDQIETDLRQLREPAPEAPPVEVPGEAPPLAPPAPPVQEPPSPSGMPPPTLETGAEGLPADRLRRESGQYRMDLRELPPEELSLQQAISQEQGDGRWGIRLAGEADIPDALGALLRQGGLLNNQNGHSLSEMLTHLKRNDFLQGTDRESLLQALQRSLTDNMPVYSQQATGHVPRLDNPGVERGYQHAQNVIRALNPTIEIQRRETRPHAEVIAQVHALHEAGYTIEDLKTILAVPPGTAFNDTKMVEAVTGLRGLANELRAAAVKVVETEALPGSAEWQDYLTLKSYFGTFYPYLAGAEAEAGRSLSILNQPMAGEKRYLQELKDVMLRQGNQSVLTMARQDLAIMTPEERMAATLPVTGEQAIRVFEAQRDVMESFQHEPFGRQQQNPLFDVAYLEGLKRKFPDVDWDKVRAEMQEAFAHEPFSPQEERLFLHRPESRAPSDVELAREVGLRQAALRTIQANLGQARPGLAGVITELNVGSMLGPPTVISNATANTGMGIHAIPDRFLAGVVSPLRQGIENLVRGARGLEGSAPAGVSFAETEGLLYGAYKGWHEMWVAANKMRQTGVSAYDPGSKTGTRQPAVTAENVGLDPQSMAGKLVDWWGEWVGLLGGGRKMLKLLETSDEGALAMGYSMERNARAFGEAKAQGLEGFAFADRVAQVMTDPTTAERIHADALQEAKYLTHRETEGPQSGLAKFIQTTANLKIPLSSDPEAFWNNIPIGRLLIPFHSIAMRAADYTMDHTPLAFTTGRFYRQIAAGGRQADIALGRMLAGTGTVMAVAGLVGAGAITGRAPKDPELRAAWLAEHPEYSAFIPGLGWFEYKRILGALGNVIAVGADTAQLMGEMEGSLPYKAAAAAWAAFDRNIWNETAGRQLGDFFEIMQEPRSTSDPESVFAKPWKWASRAAAPVLARFGTLGVSNSWMARAAVNVLDPETKYAQTFMDQIYAVTPGWSENVPRRRTITGEPQLFGTGIGPDTLRALTRAFWPGKVQQSELFAADAAILDNQMNLPKASDHLDATSLATGQEATSDLATLKGLKGAKLSGDEYERLVVLSAMNETEAKKLYGTTAQVIPRETMQYATASAFAAQAAANATLPQATPPKDAMSLGEMLDWLTTTPAFQQGTPGKGGSREAAFLTVVHAYYRYGKDLFLELEPTIGERHAQSMIQTQITRLPDVQREPMRLMLEQAHVATRVGTRAMLGLEPLQIGAR